ncbi:terminase large subunit [Clostridium botulinum]|uniref:terminase large subunit n=1 Tax=Clostridium botulinum TaxID=1491 RepID=UPI0005F8DE17|nr:terminase TerL endonuclease subunit [Clostridium botulinum]MBY6799533.1 terminase large subunit [Clostridium botulinum]NFF20881.1 terminase large subunit [Clostridium botulinum]NFM75509.1 terminase large subunit [Clostridium botulinum]NFP81061.1 terminase large subunit [Clostridium botulinum]NFP94033.1 terminase large subunit [Clostridium botulinum]
MHVKEILEQHKKEQTMYNLDDLIEELKSKWNDDKYFYDEEEARRFYKFITKLELDKGKKGQKINPLKFQFGITSEILCVKERETGFRKHREALLDISRKNGKGSLVSWIAVYLYFTDSTYGAEYIIVANDIKQAKNLFNTMMLMIKKNKTLKKYVKITESMRQMYRKSTNSYLRVLANDGSNLDSYASYVVILDEVHEYKNSDAYTKLRTGMGLWDSPLLFATTTASSGQDPQNLELELYNYAKDIEKGKFKDDKFYYAIYEAEKDCDLMDIKQQIKSNPALGIFRKYDDLKDFMIKASRIKTFEAKARRLYLNQHVALDGENAINMRLWKECLQDIDLNDLKGSTCWCGLDMAYIQDIIAYVQCFYNEKEDKYIIYPHLFTPKGTLIDRSERDNVRYDTWVGNKDLIGLNGTYVDNEELFNYIDHINSKYAFDIDEIVFDRWGAGDIRSRLEKHYTVAPFGQGYKSMSPVIRDFEIMLLDKRLIIANNPVLTWMASNVIATEDPAGNIKYDKSKCKNKIDGVIAMLMALGRAIFNTKQTVKANKYATEEYINKLYGGDKD